MVAKAVSDEKFIALWTELGSPKLVADAIGVDIRNIYSRRNSLLRQGILLETRTKSPRDVRYNKEEVLARVQNRLESVKLHARRGVALEKGKIVVFSDAHFYPSDESTAYRALLEYIKEFKPEIIVANGDLFDGTSISKHSRIMWENAPNVLEELDAVKHHLSGIENASRFKENLIWTFGNHDQRFASYLAATAPQYEGVSGFSLKDHFPLWRSCWSFWINDDTVIKHRWKGGRYAGSNNTTYAGINIVTGHTHQLKVEPFTDYKGTRYGVQTGCLANPNADQFLNYTEDNPKDWRSGFAVLTFERGQLLPPELVQVWDEEKGEVVFRGKIYGV